ncbi:thrombospondin type 3 repeat-containing protein [Patescibacteria group bacterium]|nr:thrombospondin type 3 repeat-containing protein [Patescibacteria group bacterium]MCG2690824.1 thrombospondin type 3 repeat-containing protein [Candidatus Parcubacteria bacterium]
MFSENNNNKKYLFAGIFIILVIISLALIVKYYNQAESLKQREAKPEQNISDNIIDLPDKNKQSIDASTSSTVDENLDADKAEEYVGPWVGYEAMGMDQDAEGLYDFEEEKLGTDPNNRDTDNDGLDDYYETRIYKTDPLNPDTDGDGFKDGEEIKTGYNPLNE